MVSAKQVDKQLKELGYNFSYWGRNEIKELCRVLSENEAIKYCVNGHYQGGFAMLIATDQRLLLIDRKPMYLTMEVIWYDKIGQIDFNHRLLNATICISTPNKELNFTTWNNKPLHHLLVYSQDKMAEAKKDVSTRLTDALEEEKKAMRAAMEQPAIPAAVQSPESEPQPVENLQPHMYIPSMPAEPTQFDLTLYKATRLPFTRRRYFARTTTTS